MHVIVYPSDSTGCGMYRCRWPGQAALVAGHMVNVMPYPKIVVNNSNPPTVKGINVGTANVVVFQRPGSYQIQEVIRILKDNGVAVVIDMDDDLSCIHPRNPAFRAYDPRTNQNSNWMHAQRACDMADWVTVTTPALAERYGSHGRVSVIPNHVPESYLKIQRPQNEIPVVGWAGWTTTHVDDLRVTKGIINQVLIDTGARFQAFGDAKIFNDLQIRQRAPHTLRSFANILDYPQTLSEIDIGLVPLKRSPFNEAKSWLKALEMASLGIVPVVTPTYDNMRLVELGAAVPAETPKDWYREVKELILDNDKRLEMSLKAREAASDWTIEGNVGKWVNAWKSAWKIGAMVY